MNRMAQSMRMILLIHFMSFSSVSSYEIVEYASGCNSASSADPCSNCKLSTFTASSGSCRLGCTGVLISSEMIDGLRITRIECNVIPDELNNCPDGKLCCNAPAGSYCPGIDWYKNEEDTDAGKATVGLKCAAGKFTLVSGQTSCSECGPGTYFNAATATPEAACISCPIGKYSAATGADSETTCQPCPIGKTTNATKKTSVADCGSFCSDRSNIPGNEFNVAMVGSTVTSNWMRWNPTTAWYTTSFFRDEFQHKCPESAPVISKINTVFQSYESEKDRAWSVECATLNNGNIRYNPDMCSWKAVNHDATYKCNDNEFVSGIQASHQTDANYRTFHVWCCPLHFAENRGDLSASLSISGTELTTAAESFTVFSDPVLSLPDNGVVRSFSNLVQDNNDGIYLFFFQQVCFHCSTPGTYGFNCDTCPANSYAYDNALQCLKCRENSVSPENSVGPEKCLCDKGYEEAMVDGDAICRQCTAGKFKSGVDNGACQSCGAGKYSEAAAPACSECPAGTFSMTVEAGSLDTCTSCSKGTYSEAAATDCLECPKGTFSATLGAVSIANCIQCGPGTYSETQAAISKDACIECDQGKFLNVPGASSISTCVDCSANAGYYCPQGSNTSTGQPCESGYRCSGGTEDRIPCVAGTYASTGSSTCTVCEPGTYALKHAPSCTSCPQEQTSPYHAETESQCFTFDNALFVCPPGFWRNTTSDQCTPCTVIGDIDDYYDRWRRALRYTHFELPTDLPDFYKEVTVERYKYLLSAEESLHDKPDLTMPPDRFATPRDKLARYCGLTHDAVVCPHGMIAEPPPGTGCRLPPPPPANNASDCLQGQYLNHATGACTACPRNLTTLRPGAWDPAACLFCLPAFYLHIDNTTGDESCLSCNAPTTCLTTQAFGGAPAHRMTNCSIPCGPEHMHEDNQDTYQCYFSQCMHHVRAQDIHPCALGDDGRMKTNLSASRCHPYFVPVAAEWMSFVPEQDTKIYGLYETCNDVVDHISAVSLRKSERAYLDWYYFFFATNVISQKLEEVFGWPHLRGSTEQSEKNSEAVVFDDAKEVMGMLLAKDADRLREEAEALHGANGGAAWPSFDPYQNVLPWTDLVRHVYEEYQKEYLQTWVDEQCNGTQIRKNDDFSMYHCHMKFFARPADALKWEAVVEKKPEGSLNVLDEYQCGTDNVQDQVQHKLYEKTNEILHDSCSNNSVDTACKEELGSLTLSLGGLDQSTIDREYFFFDPCNLTLLYENFTADRSATEVNLSTICNAYDGEQCSVEASKPWFCYHECVQEETPLCLKFEAQQNSSDGAVLKASGSETRKYVSEDPYMAGEDALLKNVQNEFCGANQTAREALLQRYSPEFPDGALDRFVRGLWDRIKKYWDRSIYTCRVKFADGDDTYPCVFDKDHRDGNFFRVSFVNSSNFPGGAYTLNLTKRDEFGKSESLVHHVDESEYDEHGTRPFCTVASPAEFDMVRAAAEDI